MTKQTVRGSMMPVGATPGNVRVRFIILFNGTPMVAIITADNDHVAIPIDDVEPLIALLQIVKEE